MIQVMFKFFYLYSLTLECIDRAFSRVQYENLADNAKKISSSYRLTQACAADVFETNEPTQDDAVPRL